MRAILSELRNWRDYLPAAFWALVMLALAAAGPLWAVLT